MVLVEKEERGVLGVSGKRLNFRLMLPLISYDGPHATPKTRRDKTGSSIMNTVCF